MVSAPAEKEERTVLGNEGENRAPGECDEQVAGGGNILEIFVLEDSSQRGRDDSDMVNRADDRCKQHEDQQFAGRKADNQHENKNRSCKEKQERFIPMVKTVP